MPWQLIYTSAPRGLVSGQSGFCTVARSGDLREALAQRLEQLSYYHYLRVAEVSTANRNPTVCAFRLLDLRGTKYHVLTRIQPCGLDFTARTNHLAHHLVFQAGELAQLPSPAAILRYWNGWLAAWQGEPRLLEDPSMDSFTPAAKYSLPANTWLRVTGDSGRAAGLLESECIRGCYLICPEGGEGQVLEMFCESLQLLNLNGQYALRPWRHPFTTFLQAEDNPTDFQWRACQEGTPAYQLAVQRTAALTPLRLVRVPNNSLVKVAREGQKPPTPLAAPSTQTPITLRSQEPGNRPPEIEQAVAGDWRNIGARPLKSASRGINISIKWGSLVSIGIVIAVLLTFWQLRPRKPSLPQQNASTPAVAQSTPALPTHFGRPSHADAKTASRNEPLTTMNSSPNPAQLAGLPGEEPTFVFAAPNLTRFNLPVESIGCFRNLISKIAHMDIPLNQILLSINTNEWEFTAGEPMSFKGSQKLVLTAVNETGLECSFDCAKWRDNSNNPVVITTSFATPPRAFSVHFGFSAPASGEPFRLLIVNETNPPEPLQLSMQWIRTNQQGLVSSLRAPLGMRLEGYFTLLGGRRWQLQPFIRLKETGQALYLYQDWPALDLPALGDELDFARIKERLAARQFPLKKKLDAEAQKLEQQIKQAGLDLPLGKSLGLTNENLASFSSFADRPSRKDFIAYLNRISDKRWPHLFDDDDETHLADQLQVINTWWIEHKHETVGDPNYFFSVWQNLEEIEKARQERRRLQDDIAELQRQWQTMPGTLDKVAYVGLFIIDPPRPKLEMIRFMAP